MLGRCLKIGTSAAGPFKARGPVAVPFTFAIQVDLGVKVEDGDAGATGKLLKFSKEQCQAFIIYRTRLVNVDRDARGISSLNTWMNSGVLTVEALDVASAISPSGQATELLKH